MVLDNVNERQAQIIQYLIDKPNVMFTVKDIQTRFYITAMTARKDLVGLVEKGYLVELSINNLKKGYVRSETFSDLISLKKR